MKHSKIGQIVEFKKIYVFAVSLIIFNFKFSIFNEFSMTEFKNLKIEKLIINCKL